MGFLAPWFLGGVTELGVPIFLHLLRQHRGTPRPVSSLMFFERGTQSSTRYRRLRHLVLFALRNVLGFSWRGQEEKVRWSVFCTFNGVLVSFEMRKFGFTICTANRRRCFAMRWGSLRRTGGSCTPLARSSRRKMS